jgi:hypothetical protein
MHPVVKLANKRLLKTVAFAIPVPIRTAGSQKQNVTTKTTKNTKNHTGRNTFEGSS